MIVAALLAQSALADGDPASDYLISQQVFVPYQGVSTKVAGEITAMLNDSKQKGFPLKVAVISSPSDLGAVPSLFGKAAVRMQAFSDRRTTTSSRTSCSW